MSSGTQAPVQPAAAPESLQALTEICERLESHPAYDCLTEEQEIDVGGDTAEFSYLVRVGRAAIAKQGAKP